VAASHPLGPHSSLYIVVSPTARTDASWPPRGYAGPSGRLDVVARAAAAAVSIERGAAVAGLLLGPPRPPLTLLVDSTCIGGLGERGVMEVFRGLILGRRRGRCLALPWGPERLIHEALRAGYRLYLLEERGRDIASVPGALEGRAAYLAGAHLDPPPEVLAHARRAAAASVSLGPRSLLTSHVFAYIATLRVVRGHSAASDII
jgi:tRNA pseudouridine-54 N-methylase